MGKRTTTLNQGLWFLRLWFIRLGFIRWKVFFIDFINNFQLRTKLLIAAEPNLVTSLHGLSATRAGYENIGVRREKIGLLVYVHPIVINQAARGSDREVDGNLGRYLFESQHTIIFSINPD